MGGAWPAARAVEVPGSLGKAIGVGYLLDRRELGAINIGGDGWVDVDGTRYTVRNEEAIYIGRGAQSVAFSSDDATQPAKFYLNCAPAHESHPTRTISLAQASPQTLGDAATSNRRTIYKFIVPEVLPTCQLSMGTTQARTRQSVEHDALPYARAAHGGVFLPSMSPTMPPSFT